MRVIAGTLQVRPGHSRRTRKGRTPLQVRLFAPAHEIDLLRGRASLHRFEGAGVDGSDRR